MRYKITKEKFAILFILMILVIRGFFVDWYRVPSDSMYPSLKRHQYIFVNKLSYGFRFPFFKQTQKQWAAPERGDIILFFEPKDNEILVKRVIGIGGDTIEIKDGQITRNNEKAKYILVNGLPTEPDVVQEGYKEVWQNGQYEYVLKTLTERKYKDGANNGRNAGKFVVPEGELMLMGDNRDNSYDSRFIGMISEKSVIGKVLISKPKNIIEK